jgi:hypothetical protein
VVKRGFFGSVQIRTEDLLYQLILGWQISGMYTVQTLTFPADWPTIMIAVVIFFLVSPAVFAACHEYIRGVIPGYTEI